VFIRALQAVFSLVAIAIVSSCMMDPSTSTTQPVADTFALARFPARFDSVRIRTIDGASMGYPGSDSVTGVSVAWERTWKYVSDNPSNPPILEKKDSSCTIFFGSGYSGSQTQIDGWGTPYSTACGYFQAGAPEVYDLSIPPRDTSMRFAGKVRRVAIVSMIARVSTWAQVYVDSLGLVYGCSDNPDMGGGSESSSAQWMLSVDSVALDSMEVRSFVEELASRYSFQSCHLP